MPGGSYKRPSKFEYSTYRKSRQSPPPQRAGRNVQRRSTSKRAILVLISTVLILSMLLYHFDIDLPSFDIRGMFPRRKPIKACQAYTIDRPFVPLNTTWRDLPIKHELEKLLMLTEKPSSLPRIQYDFSKTYTPTDVQQERQDAIKKSFLLSWNSYRQQAWMRDELQPITGESNDRYGGWGATLVDNLDTLWILGLEKEFQEAVNASVTIDFNDPETLKTDDFSVFETTIRHLGGFLSTYELSGCEDVRLLDKAAELADMIYVAFDNDFHVPANAWRPREGLRGEEQYPREDDNIFANVASLSVEFTRLSQLTGDMRYFTVIQGLSDRLQEQQEKTRLPGLWPHRYNARKFDFTSGSRFTLGAEADSAYEYLIKMVLLLGRAAPASQYENMYKAATETAIEKLFFRPMTPDNLDILFTGIYDTDDPPALEAYGEHLSCFLGGMFALGGRALENDHHIDLARKLTEGCVWAYNATASGIAPEKFYLMPCESVSKCDWDEDAWLSKVDIDTLPKGMLSVPDRRYYGRPEALESVFYMYRITGDQRWQEIGWDMFKKVDDHTRQRYGNARTQTVLESPAAHEDFMESFWMAETLKYMYLLFSDPNEISLDDYVFSTEAHPFRIPKP